MAQGRLVRISESEISEFTILRLLLLPLGACLAFLPGNAKSQSPPSSASPYLVGVYYFSSFGPQATNIIEGTKRVHGRDQDWWGGVDDFYGKEPGIPLDTRGWSGDWSELKPAIGYYSVRDVETLEQQIQQASDAGLSFFSFYWYPSNINPHSERLSDGLHSFLGARNRNLMRFNLTLYAHPWDDEMAVDPATAQRVVRTLVDYFKQPNYLRTPDGRPVFAIGDSRNIRLSDSRCTDVSCNIQALQNFVNLLRQTTKGALGVEPFVEVQAGLPGWSKITGADATSCTVPPFKHSGASAYPQFGPDIFRLLASAGRPVSPCMLENFDERPRQDILIRNRAVIRYLTGKTDEGFRANLAAAKAFSDQDYSRSGSFASRIIYLYAWNEWHEGGIIEPNVKTGARTLNIISEVFGLERKVSPCLDHNRCAASKGDSRASPR